MKKLFLDDTRYPKECSSYMSKRIERSKIYLDTDWVIVRSYDQFIDYITKNGLPQFISFDHDLAHEHYSPLCHVPKQYNKLYTTFKLKTGLHCAKWLLRYCISNNLEVPEYAVHTLNPTGYDNIHIVLHKELY